MSWNEPGSNNSWGDGSDRRNNAPDVEDFVDKLHRGLAKFFDERGGGTKGQRSLFYLVVLVSVILWLLTGFYIVDDGNQGVVCRLGKYKETANAGLHWRWPSPLDSLSIVNVAQQRFIEVGYKSGTKAQALGSVPREALMLTQDENIVDIRLAVQYQIKDAREYLFNVLDPEATLKQVTESAERSVIGRNSMDFVLTEGRSGVAEEMKGEIQRVMDVYKAGIRIVTVNFVDAQPPEEVQNAFEDAIKAREDEQRLINEAEAYANEVIPAARGAGARAIEEAEGYKQKVVAKSRGESGRFIELLKEYERSPDTMRQRLYVDALEAVYEKSNTVIFDSSKNGNALYLYLDKSATEHSVTARGKESLPILGGVDSAEVTPKPSRPSFVRGRDSRAP